MPTRRATAVWEGGLKGGKGTFKGESGAIDAAYSFGSRFESGKGSNPEELLAAAEAACYSMALGAALEKHGTPPTRIETQAGCTIAKAPDGFRITTMELTVRARVPNITDPDFQRLAEETKETCPVSRALGGELNWELDAKLV
jgi:osmotically inducible protein OsmC